MDKKFELKIVTPDGKLVHEMVDILNIETTAGVLGILKNHQPLMAIINISHMNYKVDKVKYEFAISGGVLHVLKDRVVVLANAFENKDEIDYLRAENSKKRAEERLQDSKNKIDYLRAELSLKRAINRLTLK